MTIVRLVSDPNNDDQVAFVTIDDAELDDIRVRFNNSSSPKSWRCEACGRTPFPACIHAHEVVQSIRNQERPDRRNRT